MKNVILAILLSLSVSAFAGGKSSKAPRDRVPGGVHADAYFYKQWQIVQDQRFPLLPGKASEIQVPDPKLGINKPRYIFHMDVNAVKVDDKMYEADDNYYHFVYNSKEFGVVLLAVHPKYRDCFDNLKKKFDQMQWVVFVYTEHDFTEEGLGKVKELVLERPRQCLGQFKYTGSKLPTAKSEFEQ